MPKLLGDVVKVYMGDLAGGEMVWTLPRCADVRCLRLLVSDPDGGLAFLDLKWPMATRSLATFDLCGADFAVLHHDDRFEQDCRLSLVVRDEHLSVKVLFELADYGSSVYPTRIFLAELLSRLGQLADLCGVDLATARGYGKEALSGDAILFYDPCVGFLRQVLRRWIRGVRGPVSWCDCSASVWDVVVARQPGVDEFDRHCRFGRFESTAADICLLLAESLPFGDQAVNRGFKSVGVAKDHHVCPRCELCTEK